MKELLFTPPIGSSVLAGITRDAVINIAKNCGYTVNEERFARDVLYIADEVFFTGTAAEVTPVREVDNRSIGEGKPGPITMELQKSFFEAARGDNDKYSDWLTRI